jgi:hypothetical protein
MFGFFGVYLHESQKKKLSPSKSSPFGEITRNSLKNESYIIYPCHSINVVNQLNHLKKTRSQSFGEPRNDPWGIAVVVRHLKGLFMMIP